METTCALFPSLIGDTAWQDLPDPVRRMHGASARIVARGKADVDGDNTLLARMARRLLGLPPPGPQQSVEVCIERERTRETWTRRFALGRMQSTLRHDAKRAHLLERLGPVTLRFALCPDALGVEWRLNGASLLGVPIPHHWLGAVRSHSGVRDGRYAFTVDSRMPCIGHLVAYNGWLEIVADE